MFLYVHFFFKTDHIPIVISFSYIGAKQTYMACIGRVTYSSSFSSKYFTFICWWTDWYIFFQNSALNLIPLCIFVHIGNWSKALGFWSDFPRELWSWTAGILVCAPWQSCCFFYTKILMRIVVLSMVLRYFFHVVSEKTHNSPFHVKISL